MWELGIGGKAAAPTECITKAAFAAKMEGDDSKLDGCFRRLKLPLVPPKKSLVATLLLTCDTL